MSLKQFVIDNLSLITRLAVKYKDYRRLKYRRSEVERLNRIQQSDQHRVFYLGITEQPNLGDMGQHYCIKKWIKENYPNSELIMFESSVITDSRTTYPFVTGLKNIIKGDDIIVFQSGYCTQDLGGDHTLMHKIICEHFHEAKILMMPQTIYFNNENNRQECSDNHNKAKNMLFLARDYNSYEQAKQMFPDIRTALYPDIVTTLIGTLSFDNVREGICLCTRNDGEKLYSYDDIATFQQRLTQAGFTIVNKDTQGKVSYKIIRANLQRYIEEEIESYSRFKVTITDRYHGTIFSLCAGTPVIILKTTDHKVTTGADWFKGVYDNYVYVAQDLDDAYALARQLMAKNIEHSLRPYFKTKYYDRLKLMFESK